MCENELYLTKKSGRRKKRAADFDGYTADHEYRFNTYVHRLLMVVVLVGSGVQLISIGIIGEYLWRNFDETSRRPIFVENKLNF